MYDHIICGRASVNFKLICSCTCTCIWKEGTCTSKRSILFFFTLCSIWTFLEHLNVKSLHMHVQYRHLHTSGVPAPVAQSVECPLRESSRSFSVSFRGVSPRNLAEKTKMVFANLREISRGFLRESSRFVRGVNAKKEFFSWADL